MKKAVCVILKNKEGKILAVSRKDDKTKFGLIGGKVDPEDKSVEAAIIREAKEETGVDLYDLKLIDVRVYGESEMNTYEQYCFVGSWRGECHSPEYLNQKGEGALAWLDKEELLNGFFSEYNRMVLAMLEK